MRGGVRLGGSDPAEDFDEAVVDVEAVLATDKGLAFLFDSDTGFLLVTGSFTRRSDFLMGFSLTLMTRLPKSWLKLYSNRCFSVSPISMTNFTSIVISTARCM